MSKEKLFVYRIVHTTEGIEDCFEDDEDFEPMHEICFACALESDDDPSNPMEFDNLSELINYLKKESLNYNIVGEVPLEVDIIDEYDRGDFVDRFDNITFENYASLKKAGINIKSNYEGYL